MHKLRALALVFMFMACPGKMVSNGAQAAPVAVTLQADEDDDWMDLLTATLQAMIDGGGFGHMDPDTLPPYGACIRLTFAPGSGQNAACLINQDPVIQEMRRVGAQVQSR